MRSLRKFTLPALITLPLSAVAAEPVKISGLMEIEASYGKNFDQTSVSDITVSKIELGFDADINERVTAHILMLHEDDGTEPMQLDEGTLSIDLGNGWYVNGGRMVIPFGIFETSLVSDPLTKELGEAHEAALQVGFERNGFYGSLYAFNGDTIKTSTSLNGDDTAEHFGANIGYVFRSGEMSLDVGADYTSSLADADVVYDSLSPNTDTDGDTLADISTLDSYVSGFALHAIYRNGPWSAIVEHIKSDKFQAAELNFNGQGAEPSATNVEAAYAFAWGTLALAYQMTDEAQALGLPERRILVGTSLGLFENTNLNIAYGKDKDYLISEGGTGQDGSNLTFQLAVTF